jgi:hypothetical protein
MPQVPADCRLSVFPNERAQSIVTELAQRLLLAARRKPLVDRQHPLRAPRDRVEADVGRDPVEPGAERASGSNPARPRHARSSVSWSASSASYGEPSIR